MSSFSWRKKNLAGEEKKDHVYYSLLRLDLDTTITIDKPSVLIKNNLHRYSKLASTEYAHILKWRLDMMVGTNQKSISISISTRYTTSS